MTDNELKRLNRAELLELLIAQSRENERLKAQLEVLNAQLEDRQITVDKVGSLAAASLQLNGVFTAAEAAATQYLENIKSMSDRQQEICDQMEAECAAKCEAMCAEAEIKCQSEQRKAEDYWKMISRRLQKFCDEHPGMREYLTKTEENDDYD